jgi:histidinol-phosphate/aromatic aminotransferase/cobyric acid decarboxylase-like protein
VEIDPEKEAIVTIGAKDALAHLLFATVGPGDTVVSPNPAYPIHQYGVLMAEGHGCMLPMPDAATFLGRLKELYRTNSVKPKMLLISFPHNPTTTCVDLDFFREIVALAHEHGTMIIHDFAYADLGFDGYKAPSILQVEGAKDVAVEIFSLSKSYNMAGWRVGFCVGNPQDDRRARAHQELSGLWSLPAHPDRFDHRAARMRGRYQEDLRHLSEAARCADARLEARRMAGGKAARIDVRVGADAGTFSRRRLAGIRQAFAREGAGGGIAGNRIRTAGRGLRAFRASGKRSADSPGHAIDRAVLEGVEDLLHLVRHGDIDALGRITGGVVASLIF